MKLVTVNLPKEYIAALEKESFCRRPLISEFNRQLIRAFVLGNYKTFEEFEKDYKISVKNRFFDFCINCNLKLTNKGRENHYFHKNVEVFELKFCCSCYNKFKEKSIEEFPDSLIEKIHKKIEVFNLEMKENEKLKKK